MWFVNVAPDTIAMAAEQLDRLGSTLGAANAAAAHATNGIAAPAADEVSAAIASLMNTQAQEYQAVSVQAATFYNQFVNTLNAGAASYTSAEIANTYAAETLDVDYNQFFGDGPLGLLLGAEMEYIELPLDAIGPVLTSANALGQSGGDFFGAMLTGNPDAAMAALQNAPANVGHAFLYGQSLVSVPLPSNVPGVTVTLDVPFGGVLAPIQPMTATVTFSGEFAGQEPITVPMPFEVGGIATEVQTDAPSVAIALALLPLFFI